MEVAARLEECRQAAQVPGPIGLLHMMEAPTVQYGIKALPAKGKVKGIREHKAHP
jgi:hypothetical protein